MKTDDTIAAISTPPGRGGIGVVRLSGSGSLQLATRIFHREGGDGALFPGRTYIGHAVSDKTGEILDTAILTFFKAPHSYTGEDVVELSCHGSPVVLASVLSHLLKLGARAAEPGEFTLRAFLNRRIDLAQAQGVRDLIDAQTAYQARLATRQLQGALSKRIAPYKQSVIDVVVHLESTLEFVEDDISPESAGALVTKLDSAIEALSEIAESFNFGRLVKEGFSLAIVGRPNVGKSSIFNRLIGVDRAIVTEIPGTTRDTLHETTSIAGIPVRLVDTAGIRQTSDTVETMGITRSRAAIADADASLLVLDASEPLTADDRVLLAEVPEQSRIVILNKVDLPMKIALPPGAGWKSVVPKPERDASTAKVSASAFGSSGPAAEACANKTVRVSALTGAGLESLTDAIVDRLHGPGFGERDDVLVTDARQHQSMRRAVEELVEARDLISAQELEEIVLLKLRTSLSSLGEVSGETFTDDILNHIFSTFCIGK